MARERWGRGRRKELQALADKLSMGSCRLVLGSYRQRAEQIKQGPRYMSLCLADCVALVPETCCPAKVWASEFRIARGGDGVKKSVRWHIGQFITAVCG